MLFKRISIVGVGLIGGSIGMACRDKGITSEVIGVGRRRSSINKALKLGAIDKGTLNLKCGISKSDLIIVSTPVAVVIKKIKECIRYAKTEAVIIDVTSVKTPIVEAIDKIIKRKKGIYFIGTHPMAGSEESGVAVARRDLFKNSMCIITPSKHTNKMALSKINSFWKAIGAKTEIMPCEKHDLAVAHISHLPHLLAYSLCAPVLSRNMRLAGPGFKDMTRIAKSSPSMWRDIFIFNKTNIAKAKEAIDKNIKALQSAMLRNDADMVLNKLNAAKRQREKLG